MTESVVAFLALALGALAKLNESANKASIAVLFVVELGILNLLPQVSGFVLKLDHVVFSRSNLLLKSQNFCRHLASLLSFELELAFEIFYPGFLLADVPLELLLHQLVLPFN